LAGPDTTPEEEEIDDEELDLERIKDPYVKKRAKQHKHQEYRIVTIGP
jgi:hypothetical protein